MTLSTDVFIQGPVDPRAVFFKCRELLGANDSHPWSDKASVAYPGDRLISNEIGIGLPALLMQACNTQYDAALCKMADVACLPRNITDPLTIIDAYAAVGR